MVVLAGSTRAMQAYTHTCRGDNERRRGETTHVAFFFSVSHKADRLTRGSVLSFSLHYGRRISGKNLHIALAPFVPGNRQAVAHMGTPCTRLNLHFSLKKSLKHKTPQNTSKDIKPRQYKLTR
jgi:hypothetical protein